MTTLNIRIRWPDGIYHGQEWPPAPLRLFQALVAGYRTGRPRSAPLDAALEHLEGLEPPIIHAPIPTRGSPVAAAVPNNDGDVVMAHWARGDAQKARVTESKQRTIRRRRPWRFEGAVTYTWQANAGTATHLDAIRTLAQALSILGQGTDLAWAEAWIGEPGAKGLAHCPRADGPNVLQVPYPSGLKALEARHVALRNRITGSHVTGVPEPIHRVVSYGSDLDPPARRWAVFSLADPETEGGWSADVRRLLAVAAMGRHAVHEAGKRAGLQAGDLQELMGHGGDHRIQIQPLPNVGHQYADGRIRRVLFVAPQTLPEGLWYAVVYRLSGAALTPPGAAMPVALLARPQADDKLLWRYTEPSQAWTTAVPAVLPGLDHRRGKPRPERSLRRMLRHAGIPEALVESVSFERAPRLKGSPATQPLEVPTHLSALPRTHLRIRWRCPVAGPLCLGAGAGYGYGVLAVE